MYSDISAYIVMISAVLLRKMEFNFDHVDKNTSAKGDVTVHNYKNRVFTVVVYDRIL